MKKIIERGQRGGNIEFEREERAPKEGEGHSGTQSTVLVAEPRQIPIPLSMISFDRRWVLEPISPQLPTQGSKGPHSPQVQSESHVSS